MVTPADALKIDRSFISAMDQRDGHSEIVGTILTLARTLRMDVVAEGIETAEQVSRPPRDFEARPAGSERIHSLAKRSGDAS